MSNGSRAPAERRVHSTRFSGGSRYACRLHTKPQAKIPRSFRALLGAGGCKAPDSWAFLLFRIRHLSSLGITRSSKVFFLSPGISPYWEQSIPEKRHKKPRPCANRNGVDVLFRKRKTGRLFFDPRNITDQDRAVCFLEVQQIQFPTVHTDGDGAEVSSM